MKERTSVHVPGEHVRTPGEVVVLPRLVEADLMRLGPEPGDLPLAHRRMHQVEIRMGSAPLARLEQVHVQLPAERLR